MVAFRQRTVIAAAFAAIPVHRKRRPTGSPHARLLAGPLAGDRVFGVDRAASRVTLLPYKEECV